MLKDDPEAIAFETSDIEVGLCPDQYRDYQLAKQDASCENTSA